MSDTVNPIPAGFHNVTVHLTVDGAAVYIDFLKRAFGAVELTRSPGPGGKLMHALLQIGDSMLMLNDDFAAEFQMPPLAQGRMPFTMNLYVADADAAWAKALEAGAQVAMPLEDQFWGDRYGHVMDPFGVRWAIASRKENLSPAQIQERAAKIFGGGKP